MAQSSEGKNGEHVLAREQTFSTPQIESHAKSSRVAIHKTKVEGIADLAAFSTFINQGAPFGSVPVSIEVSCGRPSLQIEDNHITLATWQVLIRLELENCQVKQGSVRRVAIQEGSFRLHGSSTSNVRSIRQHAAALGADIIVGISDLRYAISTGLFAKWKKSWGESSSRNQSKSVKWSTDIILIG